VKIVLDTNVLLVSVSSKSPHHWIVQSILKGDIILCVTYDILLEYHEKIEEHMGEAFAKVIMTVLLNSPFIIEAKRYFYFDLIGKDADDNKFSDCAIASNAYAIVTEDKDLNALKNITFPSINVLSIREFKEQLFKSDAP
jgi:putative PIN family toxin of toxin-antitoxin system